VVLSLPSPNCTDIGLPGKSGNPAQSAIVDDDETGDTSFGCLGGFFGCCCFEDDRETEATQSVLVR
jgi:hypothetical protein